MPSREALARRHRSPDDLVSRARVGASAPARSPSTMCRSVRQSPQASDGHDGSRPGLARDRRFAPRAGASRARRAPSHARLASFHADRGRGGRGTSAHGELPGRLVALPAPAAAASARDLRLRAARRHAGDEWAGDRLAALDELEREVDACYGGAPTWPVMRELAADDPRLRPAAGAVPAADRGEPHGSADLRVRDLGRPPRLLVALGRSRRPPRARRSSAAPTTRSSLDGRRRLHRAPARQLPPGRAARSRARPDLPAGGGPPAVRRDDARRAERAELRSLLRVRGGPGTRAARRRASGCAPRSAGGSAGRSASSRAAASPRSTRSRTRAGTSSRDARAPSRARLARAAIARSCR